MSWQQTLSSKSRDPVILWRMVIAIIAVGIILGWLVGRDASLMVPAKELDHSEWERIEFFAEKGEWWQVWWSVPRVVAARYSQPTVAALAIFAGCCWFVFLAQVLRVRFPVDRRLAILLVAVALGVLSIWPTCFLILWQEFRWNLTESADLVPGLRYFVLGVGLREEFAKLLCLLPLLAVLIPLRDEMTALVASACVGLGFAIEENVGYYLNTQATATIGRFLTANPAHMGLTGLIGLYAYRALLNPKVWGPHALAMFGLMVFAHGLYDSFSLPDLADYSLCSLIIFVLVMYQFFQELRVLRPRGQDKISLTATFLCGVALVTSAAFVYISANVGAEIAADSLAGDIVGMGAMVYLFLREMPETLVSV